MATTVHIPPDVLKVLDERAQALGVSRNSLIVHAVKRDLGLEAPGWPPGFFESLGQGLTREDRRVLRETMTIVEKSRRSKKAAMGFE